MRNGSEPLRVANTLANVRSATPGNRRLASAGPDA
jgi:hypothetical protein